MLQSFQLTGARRGTRGADGRRRRWPRTSAASGRRCSRSLRRTRGIAAADRLLQVWCPIGVKADSRAPASEGAVQQQAAKCCGIARQSALNLCIAQHPPSLAPSLPSAAVGRRWQQVSAIVEKPGRRLARSSRRCSGGHARLRAQRRRQAGWGGVHPRAVVQLHQVLVGRPAACRASAWLLGSGSRRL